MDADGKNEASQRYTRLIKAAWAEVFKSLDAGEEFDIIHDDGAEITGGGDGARIVVTGKAQLPHGDRAMLRWFDTSVFARPAKGTMGTAPKDVFRLPGINNWDISLFKNFPIKSEARYVQFRWEMYNAFNHTQFSSVDATARFDAQGNQVNTRFGQVTAARAGRVIQASLRLTF
jgi:hypothetical protein